MNIHQNNRNKYFDYAHFEYIPAIHPHKKMQSCELLFNSFDYVGEKSRISLLKKLIYKLKKGIGINNTVWGVKYESGNFGWEFYFYNHDNPELRMKKVIKIIKPIFQVSIELNHDIEKIPYFMFSIDFDQNSLNNITVKDINIYVLGGSRCDGISYLFKKNKLILGNHYNFFYPNKDMKSLIRKICVSPFVNISNPPLHKILLPNLINCFKICIANKRNSDCIYFARVNLNQFLYFLRKFNYPINLIEFIEKNRDRLNHLLYDVEFDYKQEKDKLKIVKSGYYGIF